MLQHGYRAAALLLACSLALSGCGGDGSDLNLNADREIPPHDGFLALYGLSGVVRNIENTGDLAGVHIDIYDSADLEAPPSPEPAFEEGAEPPAEAEETEVAPRLSTSSNASGEYTTASIAFSGYPILQFSLEGYASVEYQYDEPSPLRIPGQTLPEQLEPVRLLTTEQATGTVTISGVIKDALTGNPVPNADIQLRRGINVKAATVLYSTTTDSNGEYSLSVDAGTYTAHITATIGEQTAIPSYSTVWAVSGEAFDHINLNNNVTLTPALNAGQWRIVLSWSEHPRDLDSHLWAPAAGSSASNCTTWNADKHIAYFHRSDSAGTLNLDVDDVDGFGPETITIREQTAGTYYYAVHHFAGNSSIAASGAIVRLYQGDRLRATFHAPTRSSGYIWNVFKINGDTIIPVNNYRQGALASPPLCPAP